MNAGLVDCLLVAGEEELLSAAGVVLGAMKEGRFTEVRGGGGGAPLVALADAFFNHLSARLLLGGVVTALVATEEVEVVVAETTDVAEADETDELEGETGATMLTGSTVTSTSSNSTDLSTV